jgi:DNA topoisomerase-1
MKKFKESLFSNSQSITNKEANMIYTYRGNWNGTKSQYNLILLPLTGHISTLDTPPDFGWNKVPPITIVQDPNALKIIYNSTYRRIIKNYAKQVDELWIATDPDSEGDNIGFEAYNLAVQANSNLKSNIRRVWNSSLTNHEIIRAVTDAESKGFGWDTNLALSVQGRRLTDAWLGFAGTRELTGAARKVHPVKVVSVGRVQLPTLKMIVDRDLEHESHVPHDLFTIQAKLKKKDSNVEFIAKHILSPMREENKANEIYNNVKSEKQAIVQKIEKKIFRKKPPIPLNTTSAISLISRLYKLKADTALSILSQLYLEGLISYPRTENTYFKPDYPHKDILTKLQKFNSFSSFINKLDNMDTVRTNGKKKGVEDHDPIHPTGEFPKEKDSKLTEIHRKVWETITRYYISLFMTDLVTEKTKVDFKIKNENFFSEGTVLKYKGWTEICPWVEHDEMILPTLVENESVNIIEIKNVKTKTRPKPRWREYTVIKQMERLNLGTKSSRSEILKVLAERKYVLRNNRNELISTEIGRTLIKILEPIWPDIVTANFTRHVEQQMDLVAKGNKLYQDLITQLRTEYLSAHKTLLNNLTQFQASLKLIDPVIFGTSDKFQKFKRSAKQYSEKNSKPDSNTKSSKDSKICPRCKTGNLIERMNTTTKEKFFGCSGYPECKYTAPVASSPRKTVKNNKIHQSKQFKVKVPDVKCPKCNTGFQIERLNRKSGSKFLGCSNYPTCTWTKALK